MRKKHLFLMILCCAIPLLALIAIFLFKVPVNPVLVFSLLLFCPLSHFVMMKFMEPDRAHNAAPKISIECHEQPVELRVLEK